MNVFLYEHSGSLNHGCEAIVRGTQRILNKAMKNDVRYVLSSYNAQEDAGLGGIEVRQFLPRALSAAEILVSTFKVKVKKDERYSIIKQNENFLKSAQQGDICLSIGGDTYCYGDNIIPRELTNELLSSGKKCVLWGCSVGQEDLTAEKIKTLSNFTAIFARESLSYELLKKYNKNTYLYADPAFALQIQQPPLSLNFPQGETVAINLSPLVLNKNKNLFSAAEGLINYIIDNTNMNVLLVPHVVQKNNDDSIILRNLLRKTKRDSRVALVPDNLNAGEYKYIISKSRFFIGARTHATIAAYSTGVPTLALGYSVKARGLARDIFGSERFVIDSKKVVSPDELISAFDELVRSETQVREILSVKAKEFTSCAFAAGEKLRELINNV